MAVALAACGDDTQTTGGAGGSGSGGASGTGGATSTAAPVAVSASSSSASGSTTTATTTGAGGGEGGNPPLCDVDQEYEDFEPTTDTIQFAAVNPLPAGEQILFNDWNAFPNTVSTMSPDGSGATVVFEANRVWSMGVSLDGGTVAFSSADTDDHGLAIGDAIQHTFLYDVATETAEALTTGNINDECHQFSADGERLYLCRRQDTRCVIDESTGEATWTSDGYRVGRVELASGDFEYLLPEDDEVYTFHLQPDTAEITGILQWYDIPTMTRSVRRLTLDSGDVELVRDDAGFPVVSPDGTRFLFNSYTDQGKLYAAPIDGDGPDVLVADKQGSNARWSPDGTRVVFLVDDDDISCTHVEVAAADGSEADAPTRIRDCVEAGDYVTELAWITR